MNHVSDGFLHRTVFPNSSSELLDDLVPFVREGLAGGAAVYVNLGPDLLAAAQQALGKDGSRVGWSNTFEWQPHPARRLRAIGDLVRHELEGGAPYLRFLGEFPWTASRRELDEWARFDAVLNEALRDVPLEMLCVYRSEIDDDIINYALRAHPYLGATSMAARDAYVPPENLLQESLAVELRVPEGAARLSLKAPLGIRGTLRSAPQLASLEADQMADLLIAVTELVTNGFRAGAETVDVSWWPEPSAVAVQVDDDGVGLSDSLAGYRRPTPDAPAGRGLWMVRQLTDVLLVSSRGEGTSVRIEMGKRR